MSELTKAISKTYGQHREALQWFMDRAKDVVTWSEIAAHAETGARLTNQAKGIYKPKYMDYALSVKQLIKSPYADTEIDFYRDGSWSCWYFQEGLNPEERDLHASNRGLMKCLEQEIPVGALLQVKAGKGAQYRVLGLAKVASWEDGFFHLQGYTEVGDIQSKSCSLGPKATLKRESTIQDSRKSFRLNELKDLRTYSIAQVVSRRGQSKFRSSLLNAYNAKCAITSCDAYEALEAAHITPYKGPESNHAQNGVLLRADIHSLFDLGLISINPENFLVSIADKLQTTAYGDLQGRKISLPDDEALRPNREALAAHWNWANI